VRKEVEEFRKHHPDRPVIAINVGGALQDSTVAESVQEWLDFKDKIWLDEFEEAVERGIATEALVNRLATAPTRAKSNVKWRWVVRGVVAILAALAIGLGIVAKIASDNAKIANDNAKIARDNATEAKRQHRIALARQLAAQSHATLEKYPQCSLLLAVEAVACYWKWG
jgi:uncharacterized protein HemX